MTTATFWHRVIRFFGRKRCPKCAQLVTRERWSKLQLIGIQEDCFDRSRDLELRNCNCGTTLAMLAKLVRS